MDNELFDKYIKATLESGAEEVPASAWDTIQNRINANQGGYLRNSGVWWKRTFIGLALAGAAALALMLFLPGETAVIEDGKDSLMAETLVTGPVADDLAVASLPIRTEPAVQTAVAGPVVQNIPAETAVQTAVAESVSVADTAEETAAAPAEETTADTGKSGNMRDIVFLEEEKTVQKGRWGMSVNANGANNIGGHSYSYGRFATSRMDFGKSGALTEKEATNFLVPLSFGVALRYDFTEKWALSIGLSYTYLNRHFNGVYDYGGIENYDCNNILNEQHFLGIPVTAFYNIISKERLRFYAYAGGTVEKCLNNKYSFNYGYRTMVLTDRVQGVQVSASVGLGLQVNITNSIGIYLDPSVRYYFKNYLQPKSIRTVQPVQIGLELGLRWNLK